MSSVDALFHRKLRDKIDAAWAAKDMEILSGYMGEPGICAMNYRTSVGYIRALRDVYDFCEEIEKELMGGSA